MCVMHTNIHTIRDLHIHAYIHIHIHSLKLQAILDQWRDNGEMAII